MTEHRFTKGQRVYRIDGRHDTTITRKADGDLAISLGPLVFDLKLNRVHHYRRARNSNRLKLVLDSPFRTGGTIMDDESNWYSSVQEARDALVKAYEARLTDALDRVTQARREVKELTEWLGTTSTLSDANLAP